MKEFASRFVELMINTCLQFILISANANVRQNIIPIMEYEIELTNERHLSTDFRYVTVNSKVLTDWNEIPDVAHASFRELEELEECRITLPIGLLNYKPHLGKRTLCLFRNTEWANDMESVIELEAENVSREDLIADIQPITGFVTAEPNSLVEGYLVEGYIEEKFFKEKQDNAILFEYVGHEDQFGVLIPPENVRKVTRAPAVTILNIIAGSTQSRITDMMSTTESLSTTASTSQIPTPYFTTTKSTISSTLTSILETIELTTQTTTESTISATSEWTTLPKTTESTTPTITTESTTPTTTTESTTPTATTETTITESITPTTITESTTTTTTTTDSTTPTTTTTESASPTTTTESTTPTTTTIESTTPTTTTTTESATPTTTTTESTTPTTTTTESTTPTTTTTESTTQTTVTESTPRSSTVNEKSKSKSKKVIRTKKKATAVKKDMDPWEILRKYKDSTALKIESTISGSNNPLKANAVTKGKKKASKKKKGETRKPANAKVTEEKNIVEDPWQRLRGVNDMPDNETYTYKNTTGQSSSRTTKEKNPFDHEKFESSSKDNLKTHVTDKLKATDDKLANTAAEGESQPSDSLKQTLKNEQNVDPKVHVGKGLKSESVKKFKTTTTADPWLEIKSGKTPRPTTINDESNEVANIPNFKPTEIQKSVDGQERTKSPEDITIIRTNSKPESAERIPNGVNKTVPTDDTKTNSPDDTLPIPNDVSDGTTLNLTDGGNKNPNDVTLLNSNDDDKRKSNNDGMAKSSEVKSTIEGRTKPSNSTKSVSRDSINTEFNKNITNLNSTDESKQNLSADKSKSTAGERQKPNSTSGNNIKSDIDGKPQSSTGTQSNITTRKTSKPKGKKNKITSGIDNAASGTGNKTKSGTGDKPKSGTGNKTKSGTSDKPKSGTGNKTKSGTSDKPKSYTGNKTKSGTGDKPKSGTGNKTKSGTGDKPKSGNGNKTKSGTIEKPKSGIGNKTKSGTGDKPKSGTGVSSIDGKPNAGDKTKSNTSASDVSNLVLRNKGRVRRDTFIHSYGGLKSLSNSTPSLEPNGRREKRETIVELPFDYVADELLKQSNDDIAGDLRLVGGMSSSNVFDSLSETNAICRLCLWIQPHFAEKFGFHNRKSLGVGEVINIISMMNWFFRAMDFNNDGVADNVGFKIKSVLVSDQIKINLDETAIATLRLMTNNYNKVVEQGTIRKRRSLVSGIQAEMDYMNSLLDSQVYDDPTGEVTISEDADGHSIESEYLDPSEFADVEAIPGSKVDKSRAVYSIDGRGAYQSILEQIQNNSKFTDCCAIVGFIYHNLSPSLSVATRRGLCSTKNLVLVSGMIHMHKVGKYDVLRALMHAFGHMLGASHDNTMKGRCQDRTPSRFLNPFIMHPVQQLNGYWTLGRNATVPQCGNATNEAIVVVNVIRLSDVN
ncbi:unnamed protein product [Orchesella dallaii]|uniref:Peptidase M12B domain-containing protein n=1 Tax=Orchesella dallaii TaxID=48710 RepID=A0ABP1QZ58_9HEXA